MTSHEEPYTDVVELSTLLQCLGFSVKSLDMSDINISQDGGMKTVVINCQSSGLHVVLENPGLACSCPTTAQQQTSGIWQVSGMAGGKQLDKEFGCSLLGSLAKSHRDRLTKELHQLIRCIKQWNESDVLSPKETKSNKSASMIELKTPEKIHFQLMKVDTPTRYRSLDTLTAASKDGSEQQLPAPGRLQRASAADTSSDNIQNKKMVGRQSTYTLSSTAGSSTTRNKTSSPIQASKTSLLDMLIAAEKTAGDLQAKLADALGELIDEAKHDSSMSSLVLDVSKISVAKGTEASKVQFSSFPNLSGISTPQEEFTKSRPKRFESASTSHLAVAKSNNKDGKSSKLRRFSPNIFKAKLEVTPKTEKTVKKDTKSKLTGLLKPKILTPVRTPRTSSETSPNVSTSSKNKFSLVKSSIPRASKKN